MLGTTILIAIILIAGSILLMTWLGYKPLAVLSGSMEPNYHVGSLVFINTKVPAEKIQIGDVITYKATEDTVITHRVKSIDLTGKTFTTQGDANNVEDMSPIPFDDMVGKAWFQIPHLGSVLLDLPTQKGFAAGMILVAVLIILFVVPILLAPPKQKPVGAQVEISSDETAEPDVVEAVEPTSEVKEEEPT